MQGSSLVSFDPNIHTIKTARSQPYIHIKNLLAAVLECVDDLALKNSAV